MLTLSLSWASFTVFPSFFFLQLWPSFLKYRSTFRSKRKSDPPKINDVCQTKASFHIELNYIITIQSKPSCIHIDAKYYTNNFMTWNNANIESYMLIFYAIKTRYFQKKKKHKLYSTLQLPRQRAMQKRIWKLTQLLIETNINWHKLPSS